MRFLAFLLAFIVSPAFAQTFTSPVPLPAGAPIADCGREGELYRYAANRCPGPLFGVNLSGGEFEATDALRPTKADLDLYIDRLGFRLIRYPFKWDRMTPERVAELVDFVAHANGKGVPVILDAHDYTWRTPEDFIARWTELARNFPDDGRVLLDLVNEPVKGFTDPVLTNDWQQWARDSKLTIAGLRANGIRHPILLEYPQWSATFRFYKTTGAASPCQSAHCALDRDKSGPLDPLNLTFISAHRYFDNDASGTSRFCKDKTSGVATFARELRSRGLKAYITEYAWGSYGKGVSPTCEAVSKEFVTAVKANADVILGVTAWGGGRGWADGYHFKIEPPKAERLTAAVSGYATALRGE